jgi:ubiquinone/menaquinone biosynthesis C-methylase UbiE
VTRANGARPEIALRARRLLEHEADIAFRRRVCTVLEYLDPKPGERVLDAGCGLGFHLHLLNRLSEADTWGVELDLGRLRQAAVDAYAGRSRLLAGDVLRLPLKDESFDKAVLSEVLEHVEDDAGVLLELRRVLRPAGVCAITVPNAEYPVLWDPLNYGRERLGLGHFEKEPLSGIWTDHVRLYTKEEIVDLVRGSGFEVEDVRLETRYSFPFSHQVLYGLGKFLVERNLAGRTKSGRGSRSGLWGEASDVGLWRLATRLFTAFDAFNRAAYDDGPSVNICLRAVKPA